MVFHQTKEALLQERIAQFQADIEAGAQALREGRYLTSEASRIRMQARLDAWKSGQNPA